MTYRGPVVSPRWTSVVVNGRWGWPRAQKPKTAFMIEQGLWQICVMQVGLRNAPATFERLMERGLSAVPLCGVRPPGTR